MHTMFILETPVINKDIFLACQSSADPCTGLKDQRLKPTLSKMERGGKPGDSPTNDDHIVLFIHNDNYIELSKRHHRVIHDFCLFSTILHTSMIPVCLINNRNTMT